MKSYSFDKATDDTGPSNFTRVWHLAMIVLCSAAWLSGSLADDYKKLEHSGFIIHGWVGMALCFTLCLYLVYGIVGPRQSRFSQWFPFTGEQLRQAGKELTSLIRFILPEHKRRQGLAGLVQFLGILIFFWLAATGAIMYLYIEPGSKVRGVLHTVKEAHEVGGVLIPLYLTIHIGAVIAHSIRGNHVWKEIFFQRNISAEKS